MLVEFSLNNYRSFRDLIKLSLFATRIKEHLDTNTFEAGRNIRLLKSAVLYGSNASGKTNLLRALAFMRYFVLNSLKETQVGDKIGVESFALSTKTLTEPSCFEITFIYENTRYRYGFEVNQQEVCREWFFYVPSVREVKLFLRKYQNIEIGPSFKEGKHLEDKTRPNALFLSVAAQFNGAISSKAVEWFKGFNVISGIRPGYMGYTLSRLENNPDFQRKAAKYIKIADLGIESIELRSQEQTIDKLPEEIAASVMKRAERQKVDELKIIETTIETKHKQFDESGKCAGLVTFDMKKHESDGTERFLALLGPVIDTIERGTVLVVDELDVKLHPLLVEFIVKLFHSKKTNPKNAQLIFATHNTRLLNRELFRRDQIWFTEKKSSGTTDLFSLAEYRLRNDRTFEKDYLTGKYGAIPVISDFRVFDDK